MHPKILSVTGTGTVPALACWYVNFCAKKAVNSASQYDVHTGSHVHFYEISTKSHNLPEPNDMTIDDVRHAMALRGFVMNKEAGKDSIFPISLIDSAPDLAANDVDEIKNIKEKLLQAQLSPTAPCEELYGQRTEEQELALDAALSIVFKRTITHEK